MANLVPVDYDPFAGASASASGPQLVPVDYDPFAPAEGKGILDTLKAQPAQAGQAVTDIVGLMAKGAAMGKEQTAEDLADRSAGMLSVGRKFGRGRGPQAEPMSLPEAQQFIQGEQQRMKEAEDRAGSAAIPAEILGSLVATTPISKGVGLIAKGAEAAPIIGRAVSSPLAQSIATGGILGASDAAGTDRDMLESAIFGGALGAGGHAVGSALSAGIGKVAGAFNKAPAIPTAEQTKAMSRAAYDSADGAGVIVRPDAIKNLAQNVEKSLADFGYAPESQPAVQGFLKNLSNMQGENVTLKGLDTLRKVAGNIGQNADSSTGAAGKRLVRQVDDFLSGLKPADILAGDAKAGVGALEQARSLWARSSKAEEIAKAIGSADLRAASTGSGGNVDNATRQNLRRLLETRSNWTPDERAALEEVVRGTPGQNALRLVGKLSPSGNGLMAALNIGAVAANPFMAGAPIAGIASKAAADEMTKSNVQKLAKVILAGGTKEAAFGKPNALQRLSAENKDLLIRALIGAGVPLAATP